MARSFNGTSDYIKQINSFTPAAPYSIAAWFNPANTTGQMELMINQSGSLGAAVALEFRGDQAFKSVNANIFGPGYSAGAHATTAVAVANAWYHAGLVQTDATHTAAYLNGGSKGTGVGSGAENLGTIGETFLGAYDGTNSGNGTGGFVSGLLADVAYWTVALTDFEVLALANGARPYQIRPKSILRYWPLDGLASPEPCLIGSTVLSPANGTLTGTAKGFGPPVMLFTPRWPMGSILPATAPPPPFNLMPQIVM